MEAPRFYPYMTGRKNLQLLAALDGDDASARIEEVLEVVELTPRGKHKVGGYSHGMRQRLGIAAALLRRPRLLILDEPATGLDPAGMRDMRALIRRLADEGITVLLSSHQLPEVQELCDRVAIVDRGKVVYEGALADLRRQGGAGYRLRTTDDSRALGVLSAQHGVEHAAAGPHGIAFQAQESDVGPLSLALGQAGIGILALTPELATLEDLFFRLTESNGAKPAPERNAPSCRHPSGSAMRLQPLQARRRLPSPESPPMSSVAASPPLPAPASASRARRPSTLTVYRWELRKLRAQKRTYMGLGLAVVLPLIFVIVQNVHTAPRLAATASSPARSPSRAWRRRS